MDLRMRHASQPEALHLFTIVSHGAKQKDQIVLKRKAEHTTHALRSRHQMNQQSVVHNFGNQLRCPVNWQIETP